MGGRLRRETDHSAAERTVRSVNEQPVSPIASSKARRNGPTCSPTSELPTRAEMNLDLGRCQVREPLPRWGGGFLVQAASSGTPPIASSSASAVAASSARALAMRRARTDFSARLAKWALR